MICYLGLSQILIETLTNQIRRKKMKRSLLTFVSIITLFIFHQTEAYAQDRWSIEFRPSVDFATDNIADADLGTGFGFEGALVYRFIPHLATYAGWSWNHFAVEKSFAGPDAGFEETGYTFGFQFIHPIGETSLSYLIRLGGTYNHIEIENNDGDIIIDSGHGLGWQAQAGLSIPFNERFSLLPTIRYRSLNRDIKIENINTAVDLNYLSVGVGLSWSF
jgi:hypothetical protein